MNKTANTTRVWDPLVRIGHWSLVIAFFTAYFTEDELLTWHVWAGYVVGAVVLFRVVWGFTGPKHARFRDFIYSPRRVMSYFRGMFGKTPQRYMGHNPAGGVMIVALLLSLVVTVWSGLMVYAYEENAGPLKNWVAAEAVGPALSVISIARADEGGYSGAAFEQAEEFWEELHEFFANFTLFLVVVHVAGVIFSSVVHRENLVRAMITGRKRSGS